jgi:hypothetical protein
MDASKITELRQKQANVFINRRQPAMDSSTLTWQRQIMSSRYIPTPTLVGSIWQMAGGNVPGCQTGGGMSQVSIGSAGVMPEGYRMAGVSSSTPATANPPPLYPNPMFNNKGSGCFVYTSEQILYKNAGDQMCANYNSAGDGNINTLLYGTAAQVQQLEYVVLPKCFCNDSDIFKQNGTTLVVPPGADVSGNWLNPYLPIPQPYIQNTQPPCTTCGNYRVKINSEQNVNASFVHDPVVSTIQGTKVVDGVRVPNVVYSTVAPNMVFIPNNDGTTRGTLVADGTTKPRATDKNVLP